MQCVMEGKVMMAGNEIHLTIDEEFRSLIPAITEEEREQLEANIAAAGGARDPLIAWLAEDDVWLLLDGHNRYEICTRLGLPFSVVEAACDTREEAADWIDRNQLGRRNLTDEGRKLVVGRIYNRAKKSEHDGGRGRKRSGGQTDHHSEKTAERIAREHNVSEATVRRAGKFQHAVEKLDLQGDVIRGSVHASEAEVVATAKALPDKPTSEELTIARESLKRPSKRKSTRRAAGESKAAKACGNRKRNQQLARRIAISLTSLRDDVETLAETDSAYRQEALCALQSCVGHLTRAKATALESAGEHQPDDGLRAAVAKRWQAMRLWEKHWSIADMKDVRRMFMELIRDEQKQLGK
jgi:hypothetical protein